MIMKSRRILAVLAACTAVTFTGCGVVTVVPIGEEASYTGKQEFDSAAESEGDWSSVVADISQKAQDLVELLNGDGITETTAVKGTGKIKEYNTDTPKHYLVVELDGFTGTKEIRVRTDGPNSSTAIRDLQSLKNFESFTNQTEWSSYGKELNKQALAQVIDPLEIDESVVGKTVTFTGGAEAGADAVTITAVELTIVNSEFFYIGDLFLNIGTERGHNSNFHDIIPFIYKNIKILYDV